MTTNSTITRSCIPLSLVVISFLFLPGCNKKTSDSSWTVNKLEYLEKPGLSVLVFHDFYPVGKQGGIEIIQHGQRIATNGFIRMEQVNGKRFEDPARATREIDSINHLITAKVNYEDFNFRYSVTVQPDGDAFKLRVDLDKPIPAAWKDKLYFQLEIYPPLYYGKTFQLGDAFGIVTRQGNGPLIKDERGRLRSSNMARGKKLVLAAEDRTRKLVIEDEKGELTLMDDRNLSNRGWLVVKSNVRSEVTDGAIEWTIRPHVVSGWTREPMIAVSQVGYDPDQVKQAIIETEPGSKPGRVSLLKVNGEEGTKEVLSATPEAWGKFLRYDYAIFDFSSVKDPGMYMVKAGDITSDPFSIDKKVYRENVWQPTLEAYFPVQMCHVQVRDGSAIWHGACHLDDALQAPLDSVHVDGYRQYKEAETRYKPMTTVPFTNEGGWHDAGDDDLAAGSQSATTHYLVLAYELNKDATDQTTVNYDSLYVAMHRPDGIPDFVQQIKHGALNLLSGYRAAGHSFTGIIDNRYERNITGDWASQSDQLFYDTKMGPRQKTLTHSGINDDRWVFTNKDTGLEYEVMAALASSSRALKGYDDKLAEECLSWAKKDWDFEQAHEPVSQPNAYVPGNTKGQEIMATAELLYTTGDKKYADHLVGILPSIKDNIRSAGWSVARVVGKIDDENFKRGFREALEAYKASLDSALSQNPFGIPWRPRIWGVGWDVQQYALGQYYLVQQYPDLFEREQVLRVVNYVLGCHPGSNTSFVSGVGAHSVTSAFNVYRHMEYYIPGGMVSGTALIRPDFPELKEPTPWLWQQTEYVMPGGASYIFCVLAAEKLLGE